MEEIESKEIEINLSEPEAIAPYQPPKCQSQNITVEKLQKFMPKGTASKVTEEIVAYINNIENDTGLNQEYAEERVMSCMHLMGKQGVTLEKLVNAVKYCTLKRYHDNKKAWAITFPAEYDRLVKRNGFIDSHVSEYNKTYLVIEIDKMMLIPFHLQYDKIKHEALQVQVGLMRGQGANEDDRVTPHIQHLAAKAVLDALKSPDENSIELKIGASDAMVAVQQELQDTLSEIVANQRRAFQNGMNVAELQRIHVKNAGRNAEEQDIIDIDEDEE